MNTPPGQVVPQGEEPPQLVRNGILNGSVPLLPVGAHLVRRNLFREIEQAEEPQQTIENHQENGGAVRRRALGRIFEINRTRRQAVRRLILQAFQRRRRRRREVRNVAVGVDFTQDHSIPPAAPAANINVRPRPVARVVGQAQISPINQRNPQAFRVVQPHIPGAHPAQEFISQLQRERVVSRTSSSAALPSSSAAAASSSSAAGSVPQRPRTNSTPPPIVDHMGILPPTPLEAANVTNRLSQNEIYFQMRAVMQQVTPVPIQEGVPVDLVPVRNARLLFRPSAPNHANQRVFLPHGVLFDMPIGQQQTRLVYQPLDERAVCFPVGTVFNDSPPNGRANDNNNNNNVNPPGPSQPNTN